MNHSSAHGYTDNELIALFMGAKVKDGKYTKEPIYNFISNIEFCKAISNWTKDGEYLFFKNELAFNDSYDWLMPVVEKIEDMGYYFTIYRWSCTVSEAWKDETRHGISTDSKIKAVYTSVLTFIKWYNNQQSK